MERVINIVDYYQRKNNNQTLFDKHVSPIVPRCDYPWKEIVVNQYGATYNCASPAWLPKSIGSILDYDNIFDLLNSHEARAIRSEIDLGRYSYCNSNICGHLNRPGHKLRTEFKNLYSHSPQTSKDLMLLTEEQFTKSSRVDQLPTDICFDFDYTCNFKCPSCRLDVINHNQGPMATINQQLVNKIKIVILDQYIDQTLNIRWAGGEPFVSHAYLELWEYIITLGNPLIKNTIQTNGSYLKKRDRLLEKFLPYIDTLRISFDAGTADTYSKIRLNGEWDTLLENCQYVKELITKFNHKTTLVSDFVIQYSNYKEIPQYINLVKSLGFDSICLSTMWNWDTWPMEEFQRLNVTDPQHPNYQELVSILDPYQTDQQISLPTQLIKRQHGKN
jgi:wyosine [tRNA(Phe)-imidazoG37] synthetase (radical SAM superfamily)